eukprot:7072045-Alexandrium_andersonii.AAC.1
MAPRAPRPDIQLSGKFAIAAGAGAASRGSSAGRRCCPPWAPAVPGRVLAQRALPTALPQRLAALDARGLQDGVGLLSGGR